MFDPMTDAGRDAVAPVGFVLPPLSADPSSPARRPFSFLLEDCDVTESPRSAVRSDAPRQEPGPSFRLELLESRDNPVTLNWQSLLTPGVGGHVSQIEVSPHNASQGTNIVLAGGDLLGIARSTDGGSTWQDTTMPTESYEIEEFTWHPINPNIVWGATAGGPMKSGNAGQTWTLERDGFPPFASSVYAAPVQKILYDPSNANILLAFTGNHRHFGQMSDSTFMGKVYQSTDGGNNWSPVTTSGLTSGIWGIETAIYAPSNVTNAANTVFAATSAGVFKSTNDGVAWSEFEVGLPQGSGCRWLTAINTSGGGYSMWAAVGSDIYKSVNGGNWSRVYDGANGTINAVEVAPNNASILYAGVQFATTNRILKSTQGGASGTWTTQTYPSTAFLDGNAVTTLTVDPNNANRAFVGSEMSIARTTNGGTNWTNVSSTASDGGWQGNGFSGEVPFGFEWNPNNVNQSAALGGDSGKWISTDNLSSRTFGGGGRNQGLYDWHGTHDVAFTATAGTMYMAQGQRGDYGALYRTTNAGQDWAVVPLPIGYSSTNPYDTETTPEVPSVYARPSQPNRVWIVQGGSVWYNANATTATTTNWVKVQATVLTGVTTLVGKNDGSAIYVAAGGGLYSATVPASGAGTFSEVGTSGPAGIDKIKLDPNDGNRVYVVVDSSNPSSSAVWRYDPNLAPAWKAIAGSGATGSAGGIDFISDVAIDPTNNQRIVVSTNRDTFKAGPGVTGVWMTENGGTTWVQQNTGLPMLRAKTINFHPTNGWLVIGLNGRGYYIATTGTALPGALAASAPALASAPAARSAPAAASDPAAEPVAVDQSADEPGLALIDGGFFVSTTSEPEAQPAPAPVVAPKSLGITHGAFVDELTAGHRGAARGF